MLVSLHVFLLKLTLSSQEGEMWGQEEEKKT